MDVGSGAGAAVGLAVRECLERPRVYAPRNVALTIPACARRQEVRFHVGGVSVSNQFLHGISVQLPPGRRPPAGHVQLAARIDEGRPATLPPSDLPTGLVDEPVMMAAKQDQVFELRFAAVRPVPDVVRVGEPEPAAREAAAPVSRLERPADRGWYGAGAAADIDRLAFTSMAKWYD